MSSPRSAQLAHTSSSTANAEVLVYTAPGGYRTLLKDFVLYSTATTPGTAYVVLRAGGVSVAIALVAVLARLALVKWAPGFAVLNPGDELAVFVASTAGGGWFFTAHGILLKIP